MTSFRKVFTLRELLQKIADGKISPDFEDWRIERGDGGHDGIRDDEVERGHSRETGAYEYVLRLFGLKPDHVFEDNDPLFNKVAEAVVNDGGWLQKD